MHKVVSKSMDTRLITYYAQEAGYEEWKFGGFERSTLIQSWQWLKSNSAMILD